MRRPAQCPVAPCMVFALPALIAWGCVSATPPSVRTEAATPEKWTAPLPPGQLAAAETELSCWWCQFGDPRLERLVAHALAANRDLGAAAARIDAAIAGARIAGADLKPKLSAGLDGSRRQQNFIGLPIPGREQDVLSATSSSFGVALNLSWEIDLWGRLRSQTDAAAARLQASQADYAAARLSLVGQTAKAWFAVLEAHQQLGLAAATLTSRRASRDRLERRYVLGTRPSLDLRFAMSNEAAAESALAVRRRQLDAALRQLDLLLSRYPAGQSDAALEDLELPSPPTQVPEVLPAELVTRRPDLVASERRLEAAGFDVSQARASLYPQLRLTGSAGTLGAEVEDLLDERLSVWSIASSILQPVLQGGRLRAGVDLSVARYQELAAGYAQSVLRAFGEVESALAAETYLADQERALADAARHALAAESLAQRRYEAGLQEYLSVLEAQRNALLARTQLLSARRQRLDNRVDLYLALGGGFEAAVVNASTP